jgi:hypothetical protein
MAKEWYLLKSPYDVTSGFEQESLEDFSQDGFLETLSTDIASDVELCNYDLSECTAFRAIIQNNTGDTALQTMSRQMLAPIGTCKAGYYIKYKDRYWLITGLVDNNGIYEKAVLVICNYLLSWINRDGKIIQRWVNATSASQYNNGETGMKYYFVRSDQLMIFTPDDDECLLLDTDERFIIDKRCKIYERNIPKDRLVDTSNPVVVYKLTRSDTVLYDYQDSGHSAFMAYQDEQQENDGYYVIDGKGYWLCGVPQKDNSSAPTCEILYDENIIYFDLEPSVFVAKFTNSNGENDTTTAPIWEIQNCSFIDELDIEYENNSIQISVRNKRLVNKSFELSLSGEGYSPTAITITIKTF